MSYRLSSWVSDILACPRCHGDLQIDRSRLYCNSGHEYPVIDGVPIFVLPEKEQTIGITLTSYNAAHTGVGAPLFIETLGLSANEKKCIAEQWALDDHNKLVDPVIAYLVSATCGNGYRAAMGHLVDYPIPQIPVNRGCGDLLLDVGCSWGRWSISAARKGWKVVGIDPSLGALMAARRAFCDERNVAFVCGDARFLPFKNDAFRCVFSYSVLQHFSETNADLALAQIGRVLKKGGSSMIQMAHQGGLRSISRRVCSDYTKVDIFCVRYWSLEQFRETFASRIGPTRVIAEAFGGLGLLVEDWRVVSVQAKLLLALSLMLKRLAQIIKPLIRLADSVYIISTKCSAEIRNTPPARKATPKQFAQLAANTNGVAPSPLAR